MDALTSQNFAVIRETIKEFTEKVYEQQSQITHVLATVATLVQRIEWLEVLVTQEKVKSMGHGATE